MFLGLGGVAIAALAVAVVALIVDRRVDRPNAAARALLDERLAAGHITVEEHAERAAVLGTGGRRPVRWPWVVAAGGLVVLLVAVFTTPWSDWPARWTTHQAAMASAWDGAGGSWSAHQRMMSTHMGFATSDESDATAGHAPIDGARAVEVVAADMRFEPSTITVDAGEALNLTLRNDDEIVHDLTIPALGVRVVADPRGDATAGLRLDDPGTYAFFCSIPGHQQAGMRGTLVVR